jgi:hypothetical protein
MQCPLLHSVSSSHKGKTASDASCTIDQVCCLVTVAGPCADVPPPTSGFTCAQQAGFGKCGADFMVGYCDLSCRRCAKTGGGYPEHLSNFDCCWTMVQCQVALGPLNLAACHTMWRRQTPESMDAASECSGSRQSDLQADMHHICDKRTNSARCHSRAGGPHRWQLRQQQPSHTACSAWHIWCVASMLSNLITNVVQSSLSWHITRSHARQGCKHMYMRACRSMCSYIHRSVKCTDIPSFPPSNGHGLLMYLQAEPRTETRQLLLLHPLRPHSLLR